MLDPREPDELLTSDFIIAFDEDDDGEISVGVVQLDHDPVGLFWPTPTRSDRAR